MGNGSGVSRGDRNRNEKLARLRELVPVTNAIVGNSSGACQETGTGARMLSRAFMSSFTSP